MYYIALFVLSNWLCELAWLVLLGLYRGSVVGKLPLGQIVAPVCSELLTQLVIVYRQWITVIVLVLEPV